MGLVLASRVILFASACLIPLCISASLHQSDTLDYVPTSFQQRARAVNTSPNTCFSSMSLFHHFLYFTNAFFSSFILSTITYPVVSNVTSPKARILNFRLSYCLTSLCSDTQRLYSKLYFTCSTKVSCVFKLSHRPRVIRVVFSSILDLCAIASSRRSFPIIAFAFTLAFKLLDAAPNPFIALVTATALSYSFNWFPSYFLPLPVSTSTRLGHGMPYRCPYIVDILSRLRYGLVVSRSLLPIPDRQMVCISSTFFFSRLSFKKTL